MSQLWQAVRHVGHRMVAAAPSPSEDLFCSTFLFMIVVELWNFISPHYHNKKYQLKSQRPKSFQSSLGRCLVAMAGVPWAALVARRLGTDGSAAQQSTLVTILIAWLLLLLRLSKTIAQPPGHLRYFAAVQSAQASACFIALVSLNSFYEVEPVLEFNYYVFAFFISIISLVGSLLVSQGPDEFFHGRPVDRQHTCSLLERLTFTWARNTFTPEKTAKMTLRMLPDLRSDLKLGQDCLTNDCNHSKSKLQIAKSLARRHARSLLLQSSLAVLGSLLAMAPEIVSYKLLNFLSSTANETMLLGMSFAIALGASKLASITVNSWLKWVTTCKIFIPIQSSMQSLMYQKALRIRPGANSAPAKPGARGDTLLDMRSCCANACAFYTDLHKIVVLLTKLIMATVLVLKLLGWQCLIAGVSVTALSMPLSTLVSRYYSTTLAATTQLHEEQSAILSKAMIYIRQIKISAEAKFWKKRLSESRQKELASIMSSAKWMTLLVFVDDLSPIILAGVPIYVFTLLGNPLSSSVAFTSISLFKEIQCAMSALPMILPYQWNYWTELQRLEEFLGRRETGSHITWAKFVSLNKARLSWSVSNNKKVNILLDDVSVEFPQDELSLVTGKTGSGKSLLLAAIAGEAHLVSGKISRPFFNLGEHHGKQEDQSWLRFGQLAFVTQHAWLSNDTIKENILFGAPFDDQRYKSVLYACTLEKDLSTFQNGDETKVGIRGASLSGGQRWRIALARALYSRATLLLIDDVLSAVDTESRQWIVDKALCGELAVGRTRILVTHHEDQLFNRAAYQVHLSGGSATIRIPKASAGNSSNSTIESAHVSGDVLEHKEKQKPADNHISDSKESIAVHVFTENPKKYCRKDGYRLYYHASGGIVTWTVALVTIVASEGISLTASWWLKHWTSLDSGLHAPSYSRVSPATMYMLISSLSCIINAVRCFVWYVVGAKGSGALSSFMVDHVFGANLQWLETTSHGDILNSFSDEMGQIDDRLPHALGFVIENTFAIAFIIFTNASLSLYETPLVAALLYVFVTTGKRLLFVQRYLKTIQNSSVSTIQQHLSSLQAPDGITTIRSYGMAGDFIDRYHKLLNDRFAAYWNFSLCNVMVGFQFGALGALYVTLSALFLVFAGADAGSAGIALSFASRLSETISSTLNRMAAVDSDLDSVQKIMGYSDFPQESADGTEMPPSWPSRGELRVENLTVGYGDTAADTLHNISFTVGAGERIGVVGRTGAGKSSLTLAFARLIDRRSGSIYIDDVDIHSVRLDTLRQRLLIIPQDVFLGAGTIRSLLDPESSCSDNILLDYLDKFQFSLGSTKSDVSLPSGLLSLQVSGDDLSPGQRQVISLIRAMLAGRKVIIMDEVTSAVDMQTDAAIQSALRCRHGHDAMKEATVIVVAHRLATVADMDKVLVLIDGKLAEFGAPKDLYQQRGAFWNLVSHSVDKEELVRKNGW